MTAYESALAAIAERRELIAAGTPGPWRVEIGASGGVWVEVPNTTTIADFDSDYSGEPKADATLTVAAVNAFAADTDALEAVLLRHAPTKPWPKSERIACGKCARNNDWPCPDAQAVLTALGVPHE